jgi:hypothetical protein
LTAGASEPRYVHSLPYRKTFCLRASLHDSADDFMSENERQFGLSQITIDHVQVGATYTAGMYLKQDLSSYGFRLGKFC